MGLTALKRIFEIILSVLKKAEDMPVPESVFTPPAPLPEPVVPPKPEPPKITPRERLYIVAKKNLVPAHDVSPQDIANDEVACVESFDCIHFEAFGTYINGTKNRVTLSTIEAFKILSKNWLKVANPLSGDVILSVTGTGNGRVSNGHIGIVGKTHIMSNSSFSGCWEANYTLETWMRYYMLKGGLKTHFFRKV